MKKVVVAMDSMKGCLDSLSASRALASGLKKAYDDIEVVCVPVADGGEGTAEALTYRDGSFTKHISKVSGPLGKDVRAEWYFDQVSGTAFIDMASAAGLTLVDENYRNPLHTTTYGVGELILDVLDKGGQKIMLGLGGSATVDAGLGALQAMGLRLLDTDGLELPSPFTGGMLADVADLKFPETFREKMSGLRLMLLCDVEAPFTGEFGAARVFGPQKGADAHEVDILDKGMESIRRLILRKTGIDLNSCPGSGAAGGVAGGLLSLAGGEIRKGASTILDLCGFEHYIDGADLIITGEGSSDRQTLMGKIPYEILQRGKRMNIPVWLVAGRIADEEALSEAGFEKIICINSPDIVRRSNTVGQNPMDPVTAECRLKASLK